jgi:ribosome recycling factor
MIKKIENETKERMEKSIAHYKGELKTVRTGRANAQIFDNIRVDAYGSPTPLNGVGSVHVGDAHLIIIQPWDSSLINAVEKAIRGSDLGLNPSNDGKVIRVPIPPLTQERRNELIKLVKKLGEDVKVAIRNERRSANESLKKLEKAEENKISEDELKKAQDSIQKLTDAYIKTVDEILVQKEKELAEI